MQNRIYRCALICLLLFVTGCSGHQEIAQVDASWLQAHVGQSVKLSGCLNFNCITAPGAQYPRDCVVSLGDPAGTNNINLEFAAEKTDLRTRIDQYYSSIGRGCRPFGATGVLNEHRCAASDTGCVTSYDLSVNLINAFNP